MSKNVPQKIFLAEILAEAYNFNRWTSKSAEKYSVNSKQTCKRIQESMI